MGQDTVLGEHVKEEELCKLRTHDSVVSGDEDGLFRELVHYDKDGCKDG